MERKTSRNLYLVSLVLWIVGIILFAVAGGIAAANSTVNADGTVNTAASAGVGIPALIAIILFIIAGILGLIAWIGALIKTAQLSQWVWFILLIVFSGITMLVYIFAGPTEPATTAG